ncbi:hypothetical protein GCM10020331_004900 [Ectobacillus funiculus]
MDRMLTVCNKHIKTALQRLNVPHVKLRIPIILVYFARKKSYDKTVLSDSCLFKKIFHKLA